MLKPCWLFWFGPPVRAHTGNTTWTKDNIYIHPHQVFVTNGATLTILALLAGFGMFKFTHDLFGESTGSRATWASLARTARRPTPTRAGCS